MSGNVSLFWGERLKLFIDRTTMYRLMLYYLLALFGAALATSAAGYLSFSPLALLWSTAVLLCVSLLVNKFFAWAFNAVTNHESVFITPFILVLVVSPVAVADVAGAVILVVVASVAMASKYVLALGKKHIFNPVAVALVFSAFVFGVPASWWIAGILPLLPFLVVGGLVIVYKLRKFDLILAFFTASFVTIALISQNFVAGIQATFLYSAIFFFAFVMLTEPLTMPNTRVLRIIYGALVGALFIWSPHIGSFYFSPELALIVGNLFSYLVSPKGRYMLTFVERRMLANGICEYIFRSDRKLVFKSGQYLEWTLGNVPVDNRGNRRFFTIASAPEDWTLALGIRFYDKPSAFKRTLAELPVSAVVSASSLGGDFVMPRDVKRKLAFLAGGIGVTPFASMARHCIKTGEQRDAILLYSSKTEEEFAYKDVFSDASRCGWRTAYRIGAIDAEFIKQSIPDYPERLFYISGPPGMVDAMKKMLIGLGVSRFNIKTDFFPGLA
ncbi:hypothetical protein HY412_01670 [Candidatus Kaiserbacteria bacterium]|nr:hypothetical protein [Candidatus Kaiserbacteria bacterium]